MATVSSHWRRELWMFSVLLLPFLIIVAILPQKFIGQTLCIFFKFNMTITRPCRGWRSRNLKLFNQTSISNQKGEDHRRPTWRRHEEGFGLSAPFPVSYIPPSHWHLFLPRPPVSIPSCPSCVRSKYLCPCHTPAAPWACNEKETSSDRVQWIVCR